MTVGSLLTFFFFLHLIYTLQAVPVAVENFAYQSLASQLSFLDFVHFASQQLIVV